MKIATWNVNSLRARLPLVLQWLEYSDIDVLAVQETKLQDKDFPSDLIQQAGYQCVYSGQKTYNGVALLSRQPATDLCREVPGVDTAQKRVLAATIGTVRVINLYVVNGAEVGSDKYRMKLDWLEGITHFIKDELTHHQHLIVLGDFNITPDDQDVHDPPLWHEKILCSTPERQALQRILAQGLVDTFRLFTQPPESFSWWDYRGGAFRRNRGLRIDLILASEKLAQTCSQVVIDKEPRAWQRPSDHTPVIAEFNAEMRDLRTT